MSKYKNLDKFAEKHNIPISEVGNRKKEVKQKYKNKNKQKKLTNTEKIDYIIEYFGLELEEKIKD